MDLLVNFGTYRSSQVVDKSATQRLQNRTQFAAGIGTELCALCEGVSPYEGAIADIAKEIRPYMADEYKILPYKQQDDLGLGYQAGQTSYVTELALYKCMQVDKKLGSRCPPAPGRAFAFEVCSYRLLAFPRFI
jgi:hypothetical protein